MDWILMTFLFILSSSENAAASPVHVIEVEEGDDVSLECQQNAEVNLEDSLVEWSKDDRKNLVHVYRHGRDYLKDQKEEFRGRTTLLHEGLKQGNVILHLRSVRLSDSGTYRCLVKKLSLDRLEIILKVAQKGQNNSTQHVSSTTPPEEAATEQNYPVAEKMKTMNVLTIVFPVVAVGFVIIVGVVLLKCGIFEKCRRKHEAEMVPNNVQMENLNREAAEEDEDLNISVENIQQEV